MVTLKILGIIKQPAGIPPLNCCFRNLGFATKKNIENEEEN